MVQRERRKPEPGEFQDPLSNYDPETFVDEFERSIMEDNITTIPMEGHLKLNQNATVHQALTAMAEANDACVVVVDDDDRVAGIFSERDVLARVAMRYDQLKDQPLHSVMSREPVVVHVDESPARAMNVMVTGGFRHVPVLDAEDKLVGMVGARRMTAYFQKFFPETDVS